LWKSTSLHENGARTRLDGEKIMAVENIINVSEADFEFEVIKYSQNVPVVVDFWADWCRPCKALSPMLERLTQEADGAFRLARVDVDENPNLAILYNVRSLPTVKAFTNSQVVTEFVGLQPEERLREFITHLTPPSPASLALEKAEALLSMQQWSQAETIFRQMLEQNPTQPASLLGLSKSLLAQNRIQEALPILKDFPASRQFHQAQALLPLANSLDDMTHHSLPDENELDPAYSNAIRLAGRGNTLAALDGLLDILRRDKLYRQGKARQVVLAIFELMGDENPETREYRAELANILF
jgi:putative thioredoxin